MSNPQSSGQMPQHPDEQRRKSWLPFFTEQNGVPIVGSKGRPPVASCLPNGIRRSVSQYTQPVTSSKDESHQLIELTERCSTNLDGQTDETAARKVSCGAVFCDYPDPQADNEPSPPAQPCQTAPRIGIECAKSVVPGDSHRKSKTEFRTAYSGNAASQTHRRSLTEFKQTRSEDISPRGTPTPRASDASSISEFEPPTPHPTPDSGNEHTEQTSGGKLWQKPEPESSSPSLWKPNGL